MPDRTRRMRRAALAAPFLALVALTGCQNGPQNQQMTLLRQENVELRQRSEQLEYALTDAQQQQRLLETENRALNSEKGRLEVELDRASAQPANPFLGSNPFEGIQGVNSSLLDSGEVVLEVAGDVLFDSGKISLRTAAKTSLNQIASVISSQYPNRLIRIGGHTDSDPIRKSSWKTNERLSAERALAVEDYLASKGVSRDGMYVAAFGPSRPKANKKDSRRVEIVILNIPGP